MDVGTSQMEGVRMKKIIIFFLFSLLLSCSSGILKLDKPETIAKNEEFDRKVQIVEIAEEKKATDIKSNDEKSTETKSADEKVEQVVSPAPSKNRSKSTSQSAKTIVTRKTKQIVDKKTADNSNVTVVAKPQTRQPVIEDSEGFNNERRPPVMPFQVGEKVVHEVSYFSATAGTMTMQVKPLTVVNDRKSYRFVINLKTAGMFSAFYSVDDEVETFLDYETLVPSVFKLHIKESGQLKEAQSYFDNEKLKANYWEKKYTQKNGHEEKKLNWDIIKYSQNAFSGLYYMRVFSWKVGKEIAFHVSDDGKNVIFKGKAIKKEILKTDAGNFDALKIKAEVVSRGALSQTGNLFVWLSDDDRKYILRMEMEIKIGTIVSEIKEIVAGKD